MLEFILTGLLGIVLISLCCLSVYEMLRYSWNSLPKLRSAPHVRVLTLVACIFAAHIINIWLFGMVYFLLHYYNLGTLVGAGVTEGSFSLDLVGCLYYSSVIYSTLGLGDISPQGALRMITGVEGLTGFILIGWTVTFTYLAMQQFWELPHRKTKP